MSYDIVVFDPSATRDRDFSAWWEEVEQRPDDRPHDDLSATTPALRAFYEDMRQYFVDRDDPGPTGDEGPDDDQDLVERRTVYELDTDLVYMCFAWPRAAQALAMTETLALRHGVAVFQVGGDSSVLYP